MLIGSELCLYLLKHNKSISVIILHLNSIILTTYFLFWQQFILYIELINCIIFVALKVFMFLFLLFVFIF